MEQHLISTSVAIVLLPLLGALIAGLLGKVIGRRLTHWVTIILVAISFLLSLFLFNEIVLKNHSLIDASLYTWALSGHFSFDVAFLIDRLSVTMAAIVAFVSLMVHIYTIDYMADDPGYQRFFSYVSLFTFAMLILVFADNFLLLFFGWEGVGLVSYLLIGFWFERESAVFGSLKAFLVNRIGDIGFILGTAAIFTCCGNLNYLHDFASINSILTKSVYLFPGHSCSLVTLICVLFFIGAMGKSAQVPLHVWLPESMEGPTPISALIHAATMVTAGIYMVARMSPLFEYSTPALSLILILGGTTCLFMGLLAVFHQDIKRVIAYSTLSQLGYMAVALGASAYDAAIFHLITHAFFKALLFLAAGSVILALHHEQDMRKMGGLMKVMPITYLTFMIGALALSAIPPLAGFYSKDAIIEAVSYAHIPGAGYAYFCVLAGAFVTPLYIFRALFLTFHGTSRVDSHLGKVQESSWIILFPLIGLAIPSLIAGSILVAPMLFNHPTLLGNSIFVLDEHNTLAVVGEHFESPGHMVLEAVRHAPFWLAILGIFTAWYFNLKCPALADRLKIRFQLLYKIMVNQYGFDEFNQKVLVRGTQQLGRFFYVVTDLKFIDAIFVNGSGRLIQRFSQFARKMQTGYLYHYAFIMIGGFVFFLIWLWVV